MIECFATPAEMGERIEASRRAAAAQVQPGQAAVQPGAYFVRTNAFVTVYGEVLEPPPEDRSRYASEPLRHFRFTRCFSAWCPDGEIGDTHVVSIARVLTPEEFAAAREAGWPPWEAAIDLTELGVQPLYHCPEHSPAAGLFAEDPQRPGALVCGCPRGTANPRAWE